MFKIVGLLHFLNAKTAAAGLNGDAKLLQCLLHTLNKTVVHVYTVSLQFAEHVSFTAQTHHHHLNET